MRGAQRALGADAVMHQVHGMAGAAQAVLQRFGDGLVIFNHQYAQAALLE
jgi:hypothetical protein